MGVHPELAYLGLNVVNTPDEARGFVLRYGWLGLAVDP